MSSIVRAVDVGYGNTKFAVKHEKGQSVQCSIFPSIAPQAGGGLDLSGGVFQRRNTVVVEADGGRYEVGLDSKLAQDSTYGRILDNAFSMTPSYLALLRGAIFYMGVDKLDVLVIGLPVSTFEQHHEALTKRMVGSHPIPTIGNDGRPGPVRNVDVRAVKVLPQPIGGFFDHSIRSNTYGRMRNQMNLLIDPGYFTLDWVVAQGVKMINARSGAHSGGMSSVLAAMGEAICRDANVEYNDKTAAAIDDALRTGTSPRFYGKDFDISNHIRVGKDKARQFVSVLANKVGNGGVDIDNIILAGGGAEFFKEVIAEKFPNHDLVVTHEPVFANVRGFQLAGEQYAASESFKAARAA